MQSGDVCRCINNFSSALPGELSLFKDDIIQVYKVIDKIWLEGVAAGIVGKFPSSNVVKIDLPIHPSNLDLLVVFADFEPNLPDEIPLRKGSFAIGHYQIDESWWFGESYGRHGAFPATFVWKVQKEIMTVEQCEEKVKIRAKVISNISAQLPEEIDLYAGDIVHISAIIDKDWYRGESCGKKGIFPSNFVEIIDGSCDDLVEDKIDLEVRDQVLPVETAATMNKLVDYSPVSVQKPPIDNKLDANWKSLEVHEQDSLFEDDYFKQNMPSMYKPSSSSVDFVPSSHSAMKNSSGPLSILNSLNLNDKVTDQDDPQINVFDEGSTLNSISAKVEEYFANDTESSCINPDTLQDLIDIDFSAAYTEDNTGINPYGRAIFSFSSQYENELSFQKGDLVHLIKHIDSHWTVGRLGDHKGIFPTSYIDVIVDCPHRAEQVFESKLLKETSFLGHALVCYSFKSSNPDEVSVDVGDIVIINSYVTDEWVEVQKEEGQYGMVPLNHLKLSEKALDQDQETYHSQELNSIITKDLKNSLASKNVSPKALDEQSTCPIYESPTKPSTLVLPKSASLIDSTTNSNHEVFVDLNEINTEGNSLLASSSQDFPRDMFSKNQSNSLLDNDILKMAPQRPVPPKPLNKCDQEDTISCSSLSELPCEDPNTEPNSSEIHNLLSTETAESSAKMSKCLKMRLESVKELLTTEHEYIHDLESLIQVIKTNRKRKEAAAVDLKLLMSNIVEIVNFSKKFAAKLDSVSYEANQGSCLGPVFMEMADEMCEIYKVYSSNNAISVGPMLKKYQEGGGSAAAFLNIVLTELRQHKVNLLDMQAVLIKPVQRVLKYPLFIDQLVHNTPEGHPDHKKLIQAKVCLLNVAKEINEYTKRIDLVVKYKLNSSHSLTNFMQKVTMRSMAKKGSRFKTRISATIGLINQTRDLKFEDEESKFHSLVKAANTICDQAKSTITSIDSKHKSELEIIEAIAASQISQSRNVTIEKVRDSLRDICNRLLPTFENVVQCHVIKPTEYLLKMCTAPERLIVKRVDKLTDFDSAQHRLDKNKDPSRTRILEEELNIAKGEYAAFNKQMLLELPILNENGIAVLKLAMESLVAARMNLEGRIAKMLLDLAQLPEFSFQNNPDFLVNFKTLCFNESCNIKKISFLPSDFAFKSPKFGRKSSFRTLGKDAKRRISMEKILPHKNSVIDKYPHDQLYVSVLTQKAENIHELDLKTGKVVALIKNKDPLGREDKWLVDDGEKKGFVKAAILKKYKPPRKSVSPSSKPKISTDQKYTARLEASASTENAPIAPSIQSNSVPPPSNIDRIYDLSSEEIGVSNVGYQREERSPNVPVEYPPKYEDLYPVSHAESLAPRYDLPPLEEKSSAHRYDYPPVEDLQANEMDAEEACANVYEEIRDVTQKHPHSGTEDPAQEEPIYEAIPEVDGECMDDYKSQIPHDVDSEHQFYYALYRFGGSDKNQLALLEGQVVLLLSTEANEWWFVEDRQGNRGYVPSSYLSKYT